MSASGSISDCDGNRRGQKCVFARLIEEGGRKGEKKGEGERERKEEGSNWS